MGIILDWCTGCSSYKKILWQIFSFILFSTGWKTEGEFAFYRHMYSTYQEECWVSTSFSSQVLNGEEQSVYGKISTTWIKIKIIFEVCSISWWKIWHTMQSKILIGLVGYLPCGTNEPVNRQPLPDLNPLTLKTQTSI